MKIINMKKVFNIKLIITTIMVMVGLLSFCFIKIYSNRNKERINNLEEKSSMLSMMLETNTEGVYEKSNSSTWPTEGYTFNETLSGCENGGTLSWDKANKKVIMTSSSSDKCYAYFDKIKEQSIQDIVNNHVISFENSGRIFNLSSILNQNRTGTLFINADDDGATLLYSGIVDDNWVYFAGFYWRIIRINGDGTLRMIYNGPTNDQTGLSTQIAYNGETTFTYAKSGAVVNDNTYVGYMTGTANGTTYEETHSNTNDSNVKEIIDNWYENNILINDSYVSHIDTNAGFCNSRMPENGTGIGTSYTIYNNNGTVFYPIFECPNMNNDLFTIATANKGNKKLKYPVGMISVIELSASGLKWNDTNYASYLTTGNQYWTISPVDRGKLFNAQASGGYYALTVNDKAGIRPVINLKADTIFTGTGTANNPYIVVNS